MTDEELQKQIEDGKQVVRNADAHAYRKIFDAIRQEPDSYLPPSFARNVVERMLALQARKEQKRDNLLLGLGLFLFTIALVVAIVLTDFNPGIGVFSFFDRYAGLVVFGLVFVAILNWIDKRLKLSQR